MDSSNPVLRPALETDVVAIKRIYNEAIEEGGLNAELETQSLEHKLEWWKNLTMNGYPVLVICLEHEVIGYCYFSPWCSGRAALRHVAEFSIYIQREHRDQRMADRIYPNMKKIALDAGFRHLLAILLDINVRSSRSLEKAGFRVVGQLKGVADLGERTCGQYIMQCDL